MLFQDASFERLLTLATERFDRNLEPVEEQVLRDSSRLKQEIAVETRAKLRPEVGWDGPILRPSFLVWLLTDPDAVLLLDNRFVTVANVRFVEDADFSTIKSNSTLYFVGCLFENDLSLLGATLEHLVIRNSRLNKKFNGRFLEINGSLHVYGTEISGETWLISARVKGEVDIEHTTLTSPKDSFRMDDARVDSGLSFHPGFRCAGYSGPHCQDHFLLCIN